MSTTSDRLLHLAEQFDQNAKALRLAAKVLNGARPTIQPTGPQRVGSARVRNGLAKGRIVATILKEQKRAVPVKELTALARVAGVKHLTGIHNYVKAGFLTSNGKGSSRTYSFKAMPPEVKA